MRAIRQSGSMAIVRRAPRITRPSRMRRKLERAPGALELVGMRIAPEHDRGTIGERAGNLPQRPSFSRARWHNRASVGCAIALGCTVVLTTTRSRSRAASAPVLCASSTSRWTMRQ